MWKRNINNDKRAETKNKNTQTDTTNENIQIHQKENIGKQLKLEKEHYKKLFENAEKEITKLKEEISEHKLQRNLLENQVNLMDWNVVDDIDFENIGKEELNFEWWSRLTRSKKSTNRQFGQLPTFVIFRVSPTNQNLNRKKILFT